MSRTPVCRHPLAYPCGDRAAYWHCPDCGAVRVGLLGDWHICELCRLPRSAQSEGDA